MASIPLRPPGKTILMNPDYWRDLRSAIDEERAALEKTYKARFGHAVMRSLDDLAKSYTAGFESERERTVSLKSAVMAREQDKKEPMFDALTSGKTHATTSTLIMDEISRAKLSDVIKKSVSDTWRSGVAGVWVDENGHTIDAARYQDTNEPPVVKPVANLTDKPSTRCSEAGSW